MSRGDVGPSINFPKWEISPSQTNPSLKWWQMITSQSWKCENKCLTICSARFYWCFRDGIIFLLKYHILGKRTIPIKRCESYLTSNGIEWLTFLDIIEAKNLWIGRIHSTQKSSALKCQVTSWAEGSNDKDWEEL